MCTAYEIGPNASRSQSATIAQMIAALVDLPLRIIRPTLAAPVIMPNGEIREMHWGFRIPIPGGKKRTVVNSREDKLSGRTWNKGFRERRCLIPAAAFFEWVDGPRGKVPLRFTRPDSQAVLIAGIWGTDQEKGEVFSMITTEPTAIIGPIHDRMPAVLAEEQVMPYLTGELHEFGPSRVPLDFVETANFLKKDANQGDLF